MTKQKQKVLKWNQTSPKQAKVLLFVLLGCIVYAMLVSNVRPNTVDVETYSYSPRDIQSPITIEMKEETQKKQGEAADQVDNIYSYDKNSPLTQATKSSDLFKAIKKINETEKSHKDKEDTLSLDQKIEQVKGLVDNEKISPDAYEALFKASSNDLDTAREFTSSVISETESNKITLGQVDDYRERAENKIRQNLKLPRALMNAVVEITKNNIVSNYLLNVDETKAAKQKAIDETEPVVIKEGEIIVRKGDVVTPEKFKQLKLVGLLDKETGFYPYTGLFLFVLILMVGLYYLLQESPTKERITKKTMLLYIILVTFTLLCMKLVSFADKMEIDGIYFVAPFAAGAMMIKMLLDERTAIISSFFFALCASLLFNEGSTGTFNFSLTFYVLVGCLSGVLFLGKRHYKTRILKAGTFVAFVNVLCILSILFLQNAKYTIGQVGIELGLGLLSGFVSTILALGLMPMLESWFQILSTTKLIELSNPNHPLLRKLLIEAPGTYHHSIMVANLAEAGCESIGANGLVARVGAYYHDIGKTKRPHFFIENQMNMENPHDKIAPQLSSTIIIAHPYDGSKMLKEYKLPQEIIDIAEQHHGTSLLRYFYIKAKDQCGKEIPESDFRYPGPKAQSRESAVVGIADGVEAAVRSLSKPTPVKIDAIIRKIITERLEDGQFDECELTFKELDTVAQTLSETLNGIFHSRIEYPEQQLKK
ncbi:7TM receptor with intracellular metal dependent phosphohydrolase [Fictibacillus macauensis ZFHKF-1]|uniref:7TM receptor with intracellular metal dependent phosphohydrolase n=1 Tax=Fictibacillus macauensis ZFHKF-1 TaxID=1196324 RepID=I8AIB5_9BACL|nr:HD family phosphohydrolase [Fictibacillus macauensis]EIT85214.1 7TM receptor with intracellular metal dependent phosphohydrolase [Fictibacillus macauensis ZFHKF-1]